MQEQLADFWQELSDFIVYRNTLDLGALTHLLDVFALNHGMNVSAFPDQIIAFLTMVSYQSKVREEGQGQVLALLSLDSLLNNIYLYGKSNDSFKPNSSSFYGWMSSSQMSVDHSDADEREMNAFALVEVLASSDSFFKKLKSSVERGNNTQKNKRYADAALQRMDFILSRRAYSKQAFLKLKAKYIGLDTRRRTEVNSSMVNSVIFTSQLNKVVALLAEGGDDIHSALLRIYFSWVSYSDSKWFDGVIFSGDEMLINLYRYYVHSFKEIGQLFQESKHPLFRFLKNHLALLFTPVLRKFHHIVAKIAPKCGSQGGIAFYQKGAVVLQSELGMFLNQLPSELLKLLNQLKELVEQLHSGEGQFALSVVKKLFFFSFLLNQPLIEQVYSRHDPSKLSLAYTHIVNLFFQSSIKKFSSLPASEVGVVSRLIDKLGGKLDGMIVNENVRMDHEQLAVFKLRENILNHDFEMIAGVLSALQFTPKDSKQFEMKRTGEIAPESPVYKHFKGQRSKMQQEHSEVQLATWMSVGGSRDWGARDSSQVRGGVAERLKGFKTIGARVRSRLLSESEELRGYFNY